MKHIFTLLAITIGMTVNAQMDDNSSGASATGSGSVAMGYFTTAIGTSSTAMGEETTASGVSSSAMGFNTRASDYGSLVIGSYNLSGSTVTVSSTSFDTANTAFVIGNGTDTSSRSDAFKVLFNGDTYLSGNLFLGNEQITATPSEINLLSGVTSLSTGILSPITENSNTGVRLSNADADNFGNIGSSAVDLSYSSSSSDKFGATGTSSVAMGFETTASGYASSAMGFWSTASGAISTAIGFGTIASDQGSLVIGNYNLSGSTVTGSAEQLNLANTAFVIGNGNPDVRSDAFKVLFNGDTYVEGNLFLGNEQITATPSEINLLSGLTSLSNGGVLSPITENSNTGLRLSTYNADNYGDIGSNAVDLSYSSSSSDTRGATGTSSVAMGYDAEASGLISTAIGFRTTASSSYSTAMGYLSTASGSYSTAMGQQTTASSISSTAWGGLTTASGSYSTAMGRSTTASGAFSTAMGFATTASDYGSLVIGKYNSSGATVTNSATSFNTANTAFVIGNGEDAGNKSDAFKVLFNGDATVGNDLTVSGDIVVNSDMRLKANIASLGATLAKLLQIDGKTYTMKRDATKKQKIGVLAQDIEQVFPELVVENKGIKSVNYQGLVPVLINALKEQDAKLKAQEKRLARLEKLFAKMAK